MFGNIFSQILGGLGGMVGAAFCCSRARARRRVLEFNSK